MTSSGGEVHHTTDGGKTWETLSAASERTDLHDITFSDEHRGWLIGRPSGGIYLTEDGGANWRQQLASPDRTYLNSVGFAGSKEGWAVGWRSTGLVEVREGLVLHSTDGGTSWSEKDVGKKERFFDKVSFYDNRHGWLMGRDQIYYTEDGGASWRCLCREQSPAVQRSIRPLCPEP